MRSAGIDVFTQVDGDCEIRIMRNGKTQRHKNVRNLSLAISCLM